jgi:hypothetical protein
VQAAPAVKDCPAKGATLVFAPETADYQSMIPHKNWPKPGATINMRYQYLDGMCKGDLGPASAHPCRIKHYPVL